MKEKNMLLQNWIDSLKMSQPKASKPLLLISLKRTGAIYMTLLQPYLMLLLLPPLSLFILTNHFAAPAQAPLSFIAITVLILILCIAARPSIFPKNRAYFLNWFSKLGAATIFYCLLSPSILLLAMDHIHIAHALISLPFCLFFNTFLLDAKVDAKEKVVLHSITRSCKHAGLMIMYNAPIICLLTALLYTLIKVTLPIVTFYGILVLELPFIIALYITLYTKYVHEQWHIYQN